MLNDPTPATLALKFVPVTAVPEYVPPAGVHPDKA